MAVPYYGDFAEDAVVYIPFNTFDSNDPAASCTITELVAGDVYIHKDLNATHYDNDPATSTVSINLDSITGNHGIAIDTSVDAWFAAGHEYQVRVEGVAVDGGTLNAWVGSFSIERSGGALALLKNATYGLSALETLVDDLETRCSEARLSELDAGTGGKMANQVDIIQTDTTTDIPALIDALPTAVEIQAEMEENGASLLDTIRDAVESATYGLSAYSVFSR